MRTPTPGRPRRVCYLHRIGTAPYHWPTIASAFKTDGTGERVTVGAGEAYRALRLRAGVTAAALQRRRLGEVKFIGVTGSCGKTTTKELIAAVLGSELRGRKSPHGANDIATIAKTILRTSRKDAFCVVEVAAGKWLGRVSQQAQLLRPHIAVVTMIGGDHFSTFRTLDATAAEKRNLVLAAAEGGTAVLNADDPRVLAMAEAFPGRVLTFGRSAHATVRADDVRSAWPERLSFTLHHDGRALPVEMQLCGKHWVASALAALAVAVAMDVPLGSAVEALSRFEPLPRRMRPLWRDGVTFIQDDVKAPLWSFDGVFDFLAEARASRKVVVIGTISDYPGSASDKYVRVARAALEVADEVVFAGPNSRYTRRAGRDGDAERLRRFPNARQAAEYLRGSLRDGDLVLLKGSVDADRLEQVLPAS
jgi:UDP-N-acetylmuramoyl-tripeptide--D-alanyl-D-alanine ligase